MTADKVKQAFGKPMTIEQARNFVADLWLDAGEIRFSKEMRSGCWDHRRDVQAAMAGKLQSMPNAKKGWVPVT